MTFSIGADYQSSPVFAGLAPGSYTVTAKNSVNCISSPSSPVTINPQPSTPDQPTANVTQPTCTAPTGTITATAPTGMTYSIGGIYQSSMTFPGLIPGTYYLTAKNSSNCISPAITITVNPLTGLPDAPTATVVQPNCIVTTGTITITAPTGDGMTYSDDGVTYTSNTVFSGLASGSYSLTAKDSQGCVSPVTLITVNPPPSNNLSTWYNASWPYRRQVSVANPGGTVLTDYQVLITLNSSFDFSKAMSDGSDIRVTSSDGITIIPFWIETWNPSGQSATIWVKVPSIPIAGTQPTQ